MEYPCGDPNSDWYYVGTSPRLNQTTNTQILFLSTKNVTKMIFNKVFLLFIYTLQYSNDIIDTDQP